MRSYICAAAFLLISSVCFGQSVSIGAIGGGMVSNDLGTEWLKSVSTRYVIGPELDIGLPLGFGFEADALYRNEGYEITFNDVTGLHATSWQFPLLLKKTLGLPVVKPFLEAGYAPRVLESNSLYNSSSTSHGVVIGGGLRLGIGRLHLEPQVRYTRWNNSPVLAVIPNGPSPYLSSNQVDALLGISWKLH